MAILGGVATLSLTAPAFAQQYEYRMEPRVQTEPAGWRDRDGDDDDDWRWRRHAARRHWWRQHPRWDYRYERSRWRQPRGYWHGGRYYYVSRTTYAYPPTYVDPCW